MPAKKTRDEIIKIYVTSDEKKRVERMAVLADKKTAIYARNAVLAPTLDSAKMEFYQTINENFLELRKNQFILTRLLLLLGGEVLKSDDEVLRFYKAMAREAEKEFPG